MIRERDRDLRLGFTVCGEVVTGAVTVEAAADGVLATNTTTGCQLSWVTRPWCRSPSRSRSPPFTSVSAKGHLAVRPVTAGEGEMRRPRRSRWTRG